MIDQILTERERQVLAIVDQHRPRTLDQIAQRMGVTRERARQVLAGLNKKGYAINLAEVRQADRAAELAREQAARELRHEERKAAVAAGRAARRASLRKRVGRPMGAEGLKLYTPYGRTLCRFHGCKKIGRARKLCDFHYQKLRYEGVLWIERRGRSICEKEGCGEPNYSIGLCRVHYQAYRNLNPADPVLPAHNTSGYRGVSKIGRYFQANIRENGRQHNLGYYDRPIHAARAYDEAARRIHGPAAKLNFPNEQTPPPPKNNRARPSRAEPVLIPPPADDRYHKPIRHDPAKGRYLLSLWVDGVEVHRAIFYDRALALAALTEQRKRYPTAVGSPKQ